MNIKNNIGLYVHWPFCQSLCPYCDFNSYVSDSPINHKQWQDSYLYQLEKIAKTIKRDNYNLRTIFFGGGTPSLMEAETVKQIILKAKSIFSHDKIEITLESNPSSVETNKLIQFREAGINRISMGVQALNDIDLKRLGRRHSSKESLEALFSIKKYFDNYSFDLIFGRPQQTVSSWQAELMQAVEIANCHISAYELTIEKGTDFFKSYQNKELILPNEETLETIYDTTQITLNKHGLNRYEVSNYAKEGHESMHNLLYWKSEDYIGIGPGAFGRITKESQRYEMINFHNPNKWLTEVYSDNFGLQKNKQILAKDLLIDILMMGLRIKEGIKINDIKRRFNIDIIEEINYEKLNKLIKQNLLSLDKNHLKPTIKGINYINYILKNLT